ncbi:itc1p [Saccharomyces arboricola H-6]|uniref:Itc1p n=1 Tax=Saccharomyces arboricola (strain H-6 / AS 2.3317 / CBS 10644) TaxID=1160507 RepID=J8PNS9_SACAR|nr:itc1p [Saccharomyces arboricola H-6]
MVLYKRKPILLPDPKPLPLDLNLQVWHIEETGEWFPSYEEFLQRFDFYTRHHFTCEITGTSCLTFFQALDSEETQFKYVEDRFPLKLREPVARFLHFNGIRRLDALVEKVYARFKNDFFPGEIVYLRKQKDASATNANSQQGTPQPDEISENNSSNNPNLPQYQYQKRYIIKEKVQFNATINPETKEIAMPAHTKYMLTEEAVSSNKSFIVDQGQIYRDRSTFTKHLIKCFFKITLQRASSKMGAPWCVKPEYLAMYGLAMDWPKDMLKYKDDEPSTVARCSDSTNVSTPDNEKNKRQNKSSSKSVTSNDVPSKKEPKKKRKETELNAAENSLPEEEKKSQNISTENHSKKRKKESNEEAKTENTEPVPTLANVEPPPVTITSIMDDLALPYQHPPNIFPNLTYYNEKLECVPVGFAEDFRPFNYFGKLLQAYQFLNTFGPKIYLSHFSLDQFITSLKCTDAYELKGEVVLVNIRAQASKGQEYKDDSPLLKKETEDGTEEEDELSSNWQRNSFIRDMILEKNSSKVEYKIVHDDPATDEMIDNINHNGSALLIEAFTALLRLFINEDGDWNCIVVEDWIIDNKGVLTETKFAKDEQITQQQNSDSYPLQNMKNPDNKNSTLKEDTFKSKEKFNAEDETTPKSDSYSDSDSDSDSEAVDPQLERCLNYRNVNWIERLTKRQFNNSYWLIILLGILQDSRHLPMYAEFIDSFIEKIIPKDISATQLPKQLWRNFCRNLSFGDKINVLWVLIDLVLHFSPDIKAAVDDSMELCGQLRSERFKVARELKSEAVLLGNIQSELQEIQGKLTKTDKKPSLTDNLDKQPDVETNNALLDPSLIEKKQELIKEQEKKIKALQSDKNYLDNCLFENDLQRLKPLGLDRYGNRYFWLDHNGVPCHEMPADIHETPKNNNGLSYQSGRLLIQGPRASSAKFFLNVTDGQLGDWQKISCLKGTSEATKEVFGIFKTKSGSYNYVENGIETELLDCKGYVNPLIELTSIQKKIMDETPSRLLLSPDQWYCIDKFEDLSKIIDWLDNWGRKEHDLLRQTRPVLQRIEASLSLRDHALSLGAFTKGEEKLLKDLENNDLTENELNVDSMGFNDNINNKNNGVKSKADVLADAEEEKETVIDEKLETIADELMKLDDSSKTRKVLNKILDLEWQRDKLLEQKRTIINSQRPGARILARSEKKRTKISRDNKVNKQIEILTDLINYRHFKAMENVIAWKNTLANTIWGSPLRKNASGNKKSGTIETVDDKLKNIVGQTSRTVTPTPN